MQEQDKIQVHANFLHTFYSLSRYPQELSSEDLKSKIILSFPVLGKTSLSARRCPWNLINTLKKFQTIWSVWPALTNIIYGRIVLLNCYDSFLSL